MLRNGKKDEDSAALKRALVGVLHGGYWLLYLVLLAMIFSLAGLQSRKPAFALSSILPLVVLFVAPNLISFYSFYFPLFSRFLSRRKIFGLVVFGILICLAAAIAGAFISPAFFGFGQAIFSDRREFLLLTASFFVIAAIHGAVALVIRGFVVWFEEIKLKEELARKNFETEMALVKSQINPHFLFNTLNNIDVLISKDAAQASAYLNKLSGILRYMVYETKSEKIPLAAELDYIGKYLELERIRTVNPDYIRFQLTGETNGFSIAPMILFPFIENAFKHTANRKNANSIRIRVTVEKDRLVFECENSYRKSSAPEQDFGGLGNELVRKRLMLLYPEKHSLEIADDGKIHKVKLTLFYED